MFTPHTNIDVFSWMFGSYDLNVTPEKALAFQVLSRRQGLNVVVSFFRHAGK